jgi:hypothetical protein
MRDNWENDAGIDDRIRMFQKVTASKDPLDGAARSMIRSGLWEIGTIYHGIGDLLPSPRYVAKRLLALRKRSDAIPQDLQKWGWKEPNTHMVLHRLIEMYPNMKYVHVVRHGFDMAFSGNQQQVLNWSQLFGLPHSNGENPALAYKYWVLANRRAMKIGKILGPEKFMMIQFEELCAHPKNTTQKFMDFIGAKVENDVFEKMISIPKTPKSVGRYRKEDLSIFSAKDKLQLEEFGYRVD